MSECGVINLDEDVENQYDTAMDEFGKMFIQIVPKQPFFDVADNPNL